MGSISIDLKEMPVLVKIFLADALETLLHPLIVVLELQFAFGGR